MASSISKHSQIFKPSLRIIRLSDSCSKKEYFFENKGKNQVINFSYFNNAKKCKYFRLEKLISNYKVLNNIKNEGKNSTSLNRFSGIKSQKINYFTCENENKMMKDNKISTINHSKKSSNSLARSLNEFSFQYLDNKKDC